MIVDEEESNDAQPLSGCSDKIQKAYESPRLTRLDALDIRTGDTNVPESNTGMLES